MVFTSKAATAICLLWALHDKDSVKRLTLKTKSGKQAAKTKPRKPEANSKSVRKLSFCPLCLYCSSNDLSYLNHIVVAHYNAAYRCGLCLWWVLPTSQMLKSHLKHCKGFLKDEVPPLIINRRCPLPRGVHTILAPKHTTCSMVPAVNLAPSPRHQVPMRWDTKVEREEEIQGLWDQHMGR